MPELTDKPVLVVGLGDRGRGACALLARAGATVTAIDAADTPALRDKTAPLVAMGVQVTLGSSEPPETDFAFAMLSPSVPHEAPVSLRLRSRGVPIVGELELAWQQSRCLTLAIAGGNGKSTTAELVHHLLQANHRKTMRIGPGPLPLPTIAAETRDLDFLLLQANALQLERTCFLRPTVGVLLNLPGCPTSGFTDRPALVRAVSRLFANQQPFDWAIIQTEALAQLRALELSVPSKIVTFSAREPDSDLYLDRGLIISRLPSWPGPLLDTDACRLRGPHNAENFMAALAVGHALRLPLESMVATLQARPPLPHRCNPATEWNGIQFVDDARCGNIDALRNALLAARPGESGSPNVWLIAGGRDEGQDFHLVSPEISRRVRGAFLFDEAREKIRSAWSLFTPCTLAESLLEAVTEAASRAAAGDVVLFSPACSSFDQFQNYQDCGEKFCLAVESISRGRPGANPHMNGKSASDA